MGKGFHGKVLNVNLSTRQVQTEIIEDKQFKHFLGGIGLGAKYLYDKIPSKMDPLSENNIIGFVPGMLTGSGFPFSSRMTVVAKSPLTNTWGDSNMGGSFGSEIKFAGYDGIFVDGKSDNPVYLVINNNSTKIVEASHLWGQDTYVTQQKISNDLGEDNFKIACIGPAGEKLSLISAIIHNQGRAAGRSGLGAIMGSKNLKAIAIKGNGYNLFNDRKTFDQIIKGAIIPFRKKGWKITSLFRNIINPIMPWIARRGIVATPDFGSMIKYWKLYGTTMLFAMYVEMGDTPVKNWSAAGSKSFPMKSRASKLSDDKLLELEERKHSCISCPAPCSALLKKKLVNPNSEFYPRKPEYQTLAAFGSMLLNDDLLSIIKSNDLCNRYGMDTISAGSTIGFAMECYENGLLTKDQCDGIDLTWGNAKSIEELLMKMCIREGFGAVLADGVAKASERISPESNKFAMHVYGQEVPMHDPRFNPSYGTTYITDPTPGRHTQGSAGMLEFGISLNPLPNLKLSSLKKHKYSDKGDIQAILSKLFASYNALGLCNFAVPFGPLPIIEGINALTGWNYTLDDFMTTGERIQCLRQSFNAKDGIQPMDFKMPERILGNPPLKDGSTKGKTIDLKNLAKDYFVSMSWDYNTGKPSKEKLNSLELNKVAADLFPT